MDGDSRDALASSTSDPFVTVGCDDALADCAQLVCALSPEVRTS